MSGENYMELYEKWLASDRIDEQTRTELLGLKGNDEELKLRFLGYMTFGTGGLRSAMGAGTNMMNVYTVAHATQGLAELILLEGDAACRRGVVVAHDSRNNSEKFAKCAAEVLAANNIRTFVFDELRPTPELSFSVRELGCIAGINITASHNPKQYNGYKAYWEDGAQLAPDQADIVTKKTAEVDIFTGVKKIDFDAGVKDGKIIIVGKELDEKFMANILSQRVNPDAIPSVADDLRIVYTPLHGAGYRLVPEVLRRAGIKNLYTVSEQMVLDGNFPTVVKPNPELPGAFALGIELADKVKSDLIIATDPDSDRMGAMTRTKDGSFVAISGNQMAALLLDYIITAYREGSGIPKDAYAVKTIVSTELASAICKANGVKLYNVLTGFKFIGEVIKKCEAENKGTFIFGFEESYGYLKGSYARDKDAVEAAMLACEMAAYYSKKNMTLADAMDDIYARYGEYGEKSFDVYMEGLDGIERRTNTMKSLRENPPADIAGEKILSVGDYLAETFTNLSTGEKTPTGLPKSDVLFYALECGDVAVVRPSGTEPKIKIYYLASAKTKAALDEKLKKYEAFTSTLVK